MEDIAPILLNQILNDFYISIKGNAKLKNLRKKVEDGTATYVDVNGYASIISSCMKNAFSKYMKSDNLPDGRCYYNIAERIISSTEHEQYALIADFAESVQSLLNKKAQIGLKAQRASEDNEAVKSLSNVAANAREYDHVAKSISQSIERMGKNIVDRSVQQNAEFQVKAGLNPKIIRKTDGSCCEWCSRIAGVYDYPNNVPSEIYRRHNNCSCTVEYDPGSGRRQNVWNKQWRDEKESDRIENRKVITYNKGLRRDTNYSKSENYFDLQDVIPFMSITPDEIIHELDNSPIGKEYLEYMKSSGTKPILVYGKKSGGIRGEQQGSIIRIYIDNNKNSLVAAQTVIHELTHYRYDIGGCQWAEAVCMAHEKMHKERRNNLTADEKRYIVRLAKTAYPEYEWKRGGYHGSKRF